MPYQGVARGGGPPTAGLLDITTFSTIGLGDLSALVLTGDLQHREHRTRQDRRPARLLGDVVAEELLALCDLGMLPPADQVGVLLTGDLHCDPELSRRGGIGDVRSVWEAFGASFAFVAGVAGNHDMFGSDAEFAHFHEGAGCHLLDLDVRTLGGLKIGGLSGIVGDTKRPNRRSNEEFLDAIATLLLEPIDVLVLHDAPALPERGQKGNEDLRALLDTGPPILVACGHRHWDDSLVELASGSFVLNVDSRCVVLRSVPEDASG